jgi:hypothetical protein
LVLDREHRAQALDVIARHPNASRSAPGFGRRTQRRALLAARRSRAFGAVVVADARDGAGAGCCRRDESGADIVLAATDGAVAFDAVFAAVDAGIDVAVANKELVVAAGELLVAAPRAAARGCLPVDSEHSAIFQCLVGEPRERVAALVLTASGGPFWERTREQMESTRRSPTPGAPDLAMGVKNTIDSATLMNKGSRSSRRAACSASPASGSTSWCTAPASRTASSSSPTATSRGSSRARHAPADRLRARLSRPARRRPSGRRPDRGAGRQNAARR